LGQNLFSILNSQRLRTFSILIELWYHFQFFSIKYLKIKDHHCRQSAKSGSYIS
jgi:hypothetical protein